MVEALLGKRNALPMEGRFNLLPIKEEQPGMGQSVFNQRSLALPGVAAAAVNALTAPGRALYGDQPFNVQDEALNFGLTFTGGGLGGSRMAPPPKGSIGMGVSPKIGEVIDLATRDSPLTDTSAGVARAIDRGQLDMRGPRVDRGERYTFNAANQKRITSYYDAVRNKAAGLPYDVQAYMRGPTDNFNRAAETLKKIEDEARWQRKMENLKNQPPSKW